MSESSKSRPDEYDPITYHHWQEFELRRLKRSSEDFQQLFEDIMLRARPGEFERVRPYGKYGDRKCDGLIESEGIIFQVYSPDELKEAEVQKKINKDLDGAVQHWQYILKKWVFVYNVKRGITANIKLMLQQKQQQYPDIEIDSWSNDYLWELARSLSVTQRNEILGLPPSSTAKAEPVATLLVNHRVYKVNWRKTCQELLEHWKGLTTNALMKRSGIRFQLDEIVVPLGLVERQEQPKYSSNNGFLAERGSELYKERITPISQNDFFEQVLRQKQSKHSQGSRIAIIGEPGAGKTTQLQKIGDWILEKTDGIPIWIPLAEVGTRRLKEYLLGDWLQTAIQELEVSQAHRDEVGQLLTDGKVWLLLDGVDEITVSDALYQIAIQMREGWLRNVRVVLTCRLNVWDFGKNALDSFDVYRNLDFEYPIEVHQFIDKWFATEPVLQQKLKVALEQPGKERIRDMVKNPLRLTLLCYSWQLRQGELPDTKAGLYEWFIDAFYEWNKGKVPTKLSAAKRGELNRALGELAKEAIDQESSCFRLRGKFISQFLGAVDEDDSLFYLALQLGWINRVGVAAENPLENVYAFFHASFQEYFCAVAFIYKFEKQKIRTFEHLQAEVFEQHWQNKTWHEVHRFICGMLDAKFAEQLIEFLMEQNSCDREANLLLAASCLVEIKDRCSIQSTDKRLLALLKDLVNSNEEYINNAIDVIKAIATTWEKSLETLIYLKDYAETGKIWEVRYEAVMIVSRYWRDDADTLPWLKSLAYSNDGSSTAIAAAEEIYQGWGKEPGILDWFKVLGESAPDAHTRDYVVELMVEYYEEVPSTSAWLRVRAEVDQAWFVRRSALRQMAYSFDDVSNQTDILSWFKACAELDKNPCVREEAVEIIARNFRYNPDIITWLKSRIVPNEDLLVRRAAAAGIFHIILPELKEQLPDHLFAWLCNITANEFSDWSQFLQVILLKISQKCSATHSDFSHTYDDNNPNFQK